MKLALKSTWQSSLVHTLFILLVSSLLPACLALPSQAPTTNILKTRQNDVRDRDVNAAIDTLSQLSGVRNIGPQTREMLRQVMEDLGKDLQTGAVNPRKFMYFTGPPDGSGMQSADALMAASGAQAGYHSAATIVQRSKPSLGEVSAVALHSLVHVVNALIPVITVGSLLFVGLLALAALGGPGDGMDSGFMWFGGGGGFGGFDTFGSRGKRPPRRFRAYLKAALHGWDPSPKKPSAYFLAPGTSDITHVVAKHLPNGKLEPVAPLGSRLSPDKPGYYVNTDGRYCKFNARQAKWVYYDRKVTGGLSKSRNQGYPGDHPSSAAIRGQSHGRETLPRPRPKTNKPAQEGRGPAPNARPGKVSGGTPNMGPDGKGSTRSGGSHGSVGKGAPVHVAPPTHPGVAA